MITWRQFIQVLKSLPDDEGFTCAVKSKPRVMHRKESGAHQGRIASLSLQPGILTQYTGSLMTGVGKLQEYWKPQSSAAQCCSIKIM